MSLSMSLKLCVLLLALAGWTAFLVHDFKLNLFLAPACVVTGITAVIFFAGIINIMMLTWYVVTGVGLALFLIKFFRTNWFAEIRKDIPACIFVLLIFGYIIWYLKGAVFADGDSMTHWALIAREMFETNRLPNFSTEVIEYQTYPPATACWLWFVMRFTKYGEALAMFAQAIWQFVLFVSVFALNKKHKMAFYPVGALFVFFMMFFNTNIDGLRVDMILAAAFVGGVVLCLSESENEKLLPLLLPFFVCLTMIKNSGVLFAAYLGVIYAFLPGGGKERIRRMLVSAITFGGTFYLWKKHTEMVFKALELTRHSMSRAAMMNIFDKRTEGEINLILSNFVKRWFSFNNSAEWAAIIVFALVLFVAFFLLDRDGKKNAGITAVFILVGYAVYKVLLLCMYLFNLPGEEAANIGAYARYQGTYTVIMLFAALYLAEEIIGKLSGGACMVGGLAAILLLLLPMYKGEVPQRLTRPDYVAGGCHRKLVTMIKENKELRECQQTFVYTETPFSWYYVRYTFHNQKSLGTDDPAKLEEVLATNAEGYDVLVILDQDEQSEVLLAQRGHASDERIIVLK